MRNLRWRLILVVATTAVALWLFYPPQQKINLGLDLKGGTHFQLRVDTAKLKPEETADAAERAIEIIRNRVDQFGVSEPLIQQQGAERIIVQLPGVTDRLRAKELLGRTALLEFKLVSEDQALIDQARNGQVPAGYLWRPTKDGDRLLIEEQAVLTGSALMDARVDFNAQRFGEPYVGFTLSDEGAKVFAKVTEDHVGRQLAIILDDQVHSAPVIRTAITGGEGMIEGGFTQEEASDLAILLRAGALPAPILVEEERTIGPTLGRDSIQQGLRAATMGSMLIVAFMTLYYTISGVIATLALALNILLVLAVLSLFHFSLTLPGIAGIALTVGMAVDANVLIFERIREELKAGKTIAGAIATGYQKAFTTILDSNLTTLITALILYWAGTGPVKGFAVTLSVGLVANLFTAVFVTRVLFDALLHANRLGRLPMMRFLGETRINFVGWRRVAYALSSAVIVAGLVAVVARGEKNFGIDFSGGTVQQFRFQEPAPLDRVRSLLAELGLGNAVIQQYGDPNEVLIRTYLGSGDRVLAKFNETFGKERFELLRMEEVGPAVGKDLTVKALWALGLSLVGICVYVSWRFEFKYALGGIVALLHDVLVCMGAMALTQREVSLPVLAAILTVAGYSINDTIVIFDRIRENLRLLKKTPFAELVNTSINQTLSRTVLTASTVLIAVLALFWFGGEVINDFAFVFLVGTISGSYSTVYVAAPIVLDWPSSRKS